MTGKTFWAASSTVTVGPSKTNVNLFAPVWSAIDLSLAPDGGTRFLTATTVSNTVRVQKLIGTTLQTGRLYSQSHRRCQQRR